MSTQNPSTPQVTHIQKLQQHKGKTKINNQHIGTIVRGRRRAPRDNKSKLNNNYNSNIDIRSYFKSLGDQLRDREIEQTQVQAESERSPGQQELPGDFREDRTF